MPRPLHVALQVLAWLSLPMWPVTIASIWLLDDKGTVIVGMAEAICSTALFLAYLTGRVDQAVTREAGHAGREQTLLIAVDRLSETITQPQPALRAVQ